jgi:Amt family ammonium transporter
MTTNLSAACGAIVAMILTWIRQGKPNVSYTLNGALGGLVAITAGTDVVSMWGAIAIGSIAGFVIVLGVDFIDRVLKIDDPVGAIAVHGFGGAFGTIAVGLFAVEGGLFYGGGARLLGIQLLGVSAVAAWVLTTSFILFKTISATLGLRVTKEDEEVGLDRGEHATSAYSDFMLQQENSEKELDELVLPELERV